MKRSSTSALPTPKFRKPAPVDDYKPTKSGTTSQPSAAAKVPSEPKSILKRPLSSESKEKNSSSPSKSKGSISGASILKANTAANRSASSVAASTESKGGKPKVIAVRASRGDITGGMGRRKRKASTEEVNSGDDSDSDNDGEDERESDDDEEADSEGDDDDDDLEGISAKSANAKKSKKHSEENMAEAMSKILGSSLRKADANMPILARSRGAERKIEEEKMEAKARRAITNERKRLANRDRVKPDYTGMEYEKKLRKVATRGVVQLFNAIKAQQKATDDLTEKARPITTNDKDKVANLTKSSFLDLLKSGTKVSTV